MSEITIQKKISFVFIIIEFVLFLVIAGTYDIKPPIFIFIPFVMAFGFSIFLFIESEPFRERW